MESPIINGTSLVEENKDVSSLSEVSVKPKSEVVKNIPKSSSSFAEMRSGFSVSNYLIGLCFMKSLYYNVSFSFYQEELTNFLVSGDIEKLKLKWSSYQAKYVSCYYLVYLLIYDISHQLHLFQRYYKKSINGTSG